MPLQVLLVDSRGEAQRSWWTGLFPPDVAVGAVGEPSDPDGWRSLLPSSDVVAGYWPRLLAADLERATRLKMVVQIGLHPPAVDPAELARRGVVWRVERNPSNVAVAEHALLLTLALVRRLVPIVAVLASGRDAHPRPPAPTHEEQYAFNWADVAGVGLLYGRTIGLVGLGEIGLEVARRLAAFGARVVYHKRRRLRPDLEAALGIEYRPFADLLPEVDILSLHAPHTDETERLIGSQALGRMRRGSLLVNTARGGLVDESALVAALRSGHLAGAGLDVYEREPLPHDSELRSLENVLLTPHTAAVRPETLQNNVFAPLVENVARLAAGQPPHPRAEADLVYVTP